MGIKATVKKKLLIAEVLIKRATDAICQLPSLWVGLAFSLSANQIRDSVSRLVRPSKS